MDMVFVSDCLFWSLVVLGCSIGAIVLGILSLVLSEVTNLGIFAGVGIALPIIGKFIVSISAIATLVFFIMWVIGNAFFV